MIRRSPSGVTFETLVSDIVEQTKSTPNFILRLMRDDGAVVYLNGKEIARSNMPQGTITEKSYASQVVGGKDETRVFEFVVSPKHLREGENVIAAEVHQIHQQSSDIGFMLKLSVETGIGDFIARLG